MDFTLTFIKLFYFGLTMAAPLLIFLALLILGLGQLVGRRESWSRFDAFYWAFITATTVGYGDIRPMNHSSKALSIIIALIGMVFTGIMVALAVQSAIESFKIIADLSQVKETIQHIK